MDIKRKSHFRNLDSDSRKFNEWVHKIETMNGRIYEKYDLETSLGKTVVYGLNTEDKSLPVLFVFPGFRTSSLIWDFDKGMNNLGLRMRIFFVETNGQPNLSDGNSPDINGLDYGHWANEVFNSLNIESAYVAGASFGGIVSMKLAITNPKRIKRAFLLNPGCFKFISMKPRVMLNSLLPVFKPTKENVMRFLDKMVFHDPDHVLSKEAYALLVEYELLAIKKYKDNTQKPRSMGKQLLSVKVPIHLILGDKDELFPFDKNLKIAKKLLHDNIKSVKIIENVSHGIECSSMAMEEIGRIVSEDLVH